MKRAPAVSQTRHMYTNNPSFETMADKWTYVSFLYKTAFLYGRVAALPCSVLSDLLSLFAPASFQCK